MHNNESKVGEKIEFNSKISEGIECVELCSKIGLKSMSIDDRYFAIHRDLEPVSIAIRYDSIPNIDSKSADRIAVYAYR
jgi:hypothetical protein